MAKLSARLTGDARSLLIKIARDDHERRIGRAQIAVIEAGLSRLKQKSKITKHIFVPGDDTMCSVEAASELTKRVDQAGDKLNLLKRTHIVQELMEIGLTVYWDKYEKQRRASPGKAAEGET